MRLFLLLLSLVTLGIAAPLPAVGASFDCSKASTPFERAICDNPDLSALDERLAKTYATAAGGLSEPALEQLRIGQRSWLTYAQQACTRNAEPLTRGSYDERGLSCLADLFSSRSRVLESSRMMDGRRFYPVGQYSAVVDPYEAEDPDSSWPVAQHELAMVQLDSDESFAASFNQYVTDEAEEMAGPQVGSETVVDDSSTDSIHSLTIEELAGDGRITLLANTYWYGHGAAHGNWTISYRHYLVEEGRAIVANDLFAARGWEKALLRLAVAALREEHGDMLMLDDTKYIAQSVIDPARWDLSDSYDLIIQFQPYEVAAYAYGAPTARISWAELEPYLAETADKVRHGF